MGMYDHIHYNGECFQSKDFGCVMADYFVENDRLFVSVGYYEDVPMDERPYPDEPQDSLLGICGSVRWVETERKDLEFHGKLDFYDTERELVAKFTDGVLVEIKSVPEEVKELLE